MSNKAIVDSVLRPHCALPPPFPGRYCIFRREENPLPVIGDAAYRKRAGGGPSRGHMQQAQKIGKDRPCGSGDILADRQTDRQTYSSQYFATAIAGEVGLILARNLRAICI